MLGRAAVFHVTGGRGWTVFGIPSTPRGPTSRPIGLVRSGFNATQQPSSQGRCLTDPLGLWEGSGSAGAGEADRLLLWVGGRRSTATRRVFAAVRLRRAWFCHRRRRRRELSPGAISETMLQPVAPPGSLDDQQAAEPAPRRAGGTDHAAATGDEKARALVAAWRSRMVPRASREVLGCWAARSERTLGFLTRGP